MSWPGAIGISGKNGQIKLAVKVDEFIISQNILFQKRRLSAFFSIEGGLFDRFHFMKKQICKLFQIQRGKKQGERKTRGEKNKAVSR